MSKTFRTIFPILAALVQILQFFTNSAAQDIDVRIKISADSPSNAEISGRFTSPKPRRNPRNLSFLNEYAGVTALAERVSNVEIAHGDGRFITSKRFNAGEYVANTDFTSWKYRVDLTPLKQHAAAAHVSWVKGDVGILMLDDLLPQGSGDKIAATVRMDIPAGWTVFTATPTARDGAFEVDDVEKASFVIGRNWREINTGQLRLLIAGEWQFSDDDAAKLAVEVFDSYVKMFGSAPTSNAQIMIMKFPGNVDIGNWEADTRGSSITIASSDMPFKTQSLQRLHEQLRHEIFHLWIPNGVNLSGNYDWFYEGFALYQSLKLGVIANRIRFDDYLDTLSRAYNIDTAPSQRTSLIDAAKNRWSGANTQVYARGMLVAFLCDLALLETLKGKISTDNLVREVYQKYHGVPKRQDGNVAVIEMFRGHAELRSVVDRYITGADKIDWRDELSAAGIEAVTENSFTTLKVKAKASGQQKDLLDKLGYNNWRKLMVKNR